MAREICTSLKTYTETRPQTKLTEYVINDRLVFASQPEPEDLADIAARGFTTVMNMRSDPERAAIEGQNAAEAGLRYQYLSLPAYQLEPEHISQFQAALDTLQDEKIYIHCRSGSRIGLFWMLKRMTIDGLSEAAAEAELSAAGYDREGIETFQFCSEDYFERSTEVVPG